MQNEIKIYTPESLRSKGANSWKLLVRDLWACRELIWRLILRDISVRYRQSFLGYVWAVLPQIATVALFAFLSKHRVFDMGETTLPYVIHALWSISVWQLFSSCLIGCTNSLVNAGSLVTKINFPKEALVIASAGQPVLEFLIRLVPVGCMMLWYGFVPSWSILFIPLILALTILMALGVGLVFSIVNLIFRDVGNAVNIALTFGMFLAPILYPPPRQEPFALINIVNPFSPLLIATQDLLTGVTLTHPTALVVMSLFSVAVFVLGWKVFHITMPRVTERA